MIIGEGGAHAWKIGERASSGGKADRVHKRRHDTVNAARISRSHGLHGEGQGSLRLAAFAQHFLGAGMAFAAAGADIEVLAQVGQRGHAILGSLTDFSVGDVIANTDDHCYTHLAKSQKRAVLPAGLAGRCLSCIYAVRISLFSCVMRSLYIRPP